MPKADKTEDELFAAVDALLEGPESLLPEPAERARLREAAGVPQSAVAQALSTTTQTVKNWESGRSEPRPPRLAAYKRLLDGWAEKFPAPAPAPAAAAVPAAFTQAAPETAAAPAAVERGPRGRGPNRCPRRGRRHAGAPCGPGRIVAPTRCCEGRCPRRHRSCHLRPPVPARPAGGPGW
jgi:DNA-binding transcriptional regulator YiaG